jgi:hypothetical protein
VKGIAVVLLAVIASFAASVASAQAPLFKRGATLVEFFQFPQTVTGAAGKRYANPAYPNARKALTTFDFDQLRAIGFDHIRVPLDVGPLLIEGGAQWREIVGQLHAVIETLHRHRLGVVVTLFPPAPDVGVGMPQLDGLQGPNFQHYVAIVTRIAAELSTVTSGAVALEPMNEPQEECRAASGADWSAYQEALVADIRRVNPQIPLFLTGGCWSSIEGTVLIDTPLLRDPRNLVSVHFYLPFLFTHQTATWAMPYIAGVIGVPYPASEGSAAQTIAATAERFRTLDLPSAAKDAQLAEAGRAIQWYFSEAEGPATMEQWMAKLAAWQAKEGVPSDHIVFTEFGAIKELDGGVEINRSSRARWLHDASAAFERHGWSWTVFGLRDGLFAIYDNEFDAAPNPRLLSALGLSPLTH